MGRPRGDGAGKGGGQKQAWALLSATGGGIGGGLGEDERTVGRHKCG